MSSAAGLICGIEEVRVRRSVTTAKLKLAVHDGWFGIKRSLNRSVRSHIESDLKDWDRDGEVDSVCYPKGSKSSELINLYVNGVLRRDKL